MERLVTKAGGGGPAVPTEIDMDFAFDLDRETFNGLQRIFNQLCAVTDILGDDYDIDRLRELIEADRDGRCVVLPCKVGTPVYSVRHKRIPDDDYRMSFHDELSVVSQPFNLFHADCIGKTVFLTREEAEKALKER